MKILVTGASGQLGHDVVKVLNARNIENIGVSSKDFDITNFENTKSFLENYIPDAVIHCAAYTAVDMAEDEADTAYAVNSKGTENIAKVCRIIDAKMIFISTDYVFEGVGNEAYEIGSCIHPLSVYGKTKADGEIKVRSILKKYFIVRISWVFGKNGGNFVKTMLSLGKNKAEINVVSDQIGSPTYTIDLARLLCDMVVTEKYGIYHATNEGYCSWADFAEEIFKYANINCKVNRVLTKEYPVKAKRPLNSRLSKKKLDKAGFKRLPAWQNALKRFLSEIN